MKKGLTLIEIIIALMIIGMLLAPVILFFNQTIKNYTLGRPDIKTVKVVIDAMNEIESLLRQGEIILKQEAQIISFTIIINDQIKLITFEEENNLIKRTDDNLVRYTPYYNTPDSPNSEKIDLNLYFKYPDDKSVIIIIKGTPKIIPQGMQNPSFTLNTMVKLRNRN